MILDRLKTYALGILAALVAGLGILAKILSAQKRAAQAEAEQQQARADAAKTATDTLERINTGQADLADQQRQERDDVRKSVRQGNRDQLEDHRDEEAK